MRTLKLITVIFLLVALLLAGCAAVGGSGASSGTATRPAVEDKPISVVATVFPAYDWARQILGADNDRVALTLLLDKGTDFHNYQPTVEDIYKISTCDLFIYVGGESDGQWVPDALAQATNPNQRVVCLLDALGSAARTEAPLEGMEPEDEEEDAYDEHVWLSLRNAAALCAVIQKALQGIDPQGGEAYQKNLEVYREKLEALDAAYAAAVAAAPRRELLFADRFPFRYLAEDYGLSCWAAFSGCSAETEASFKTVNFLVNKADELGLAHILVLDSSDTRLAETIIANSRNKDADVLRLNSLQAVTARDVENGVSYVGVMEENLEVLKTALGG